VKRPWWPSMEGTRADDSRQRSVPRTDTTGAPIDVQGQEARGKKVPTVEPKKKSAKAIRALGLMAAGLLLASCATAPRSPEQARLDACLAKVDRDVITYARVEPGNRF